MAEEFNVHECSKYIEEELTNIALLPRPHLGVLGTIFEDKFGFVSDDRSGIEEEAEAIGIEEIPTLAEVEEKYRFIPNRCKINIVLKPKSSNSSAAIDIIFFYRKRHSDKLPENDLDPSPQNNFEREKIHLIIPVTFPFPKKVKVGSDEIETNMSNDLCTFIYEWKRKSMPYRIKDGEADKASEHTYGLRIRGLLQKLVDVDFRLHLELENTSDESKAAFVLDPLSKKDKPVYNYGYLFDFRILTEINDAVITEIADTRNITPYSEDGNIKFPTNKCEFRDYTFIKENIPKLKPSIGDNGSIERPSESLAKLQYPLNPLIGEALEKGPKEYSSLYLFQKEAIDKITKNLNESPSRINAITARTAGGKTETFMLPIIDYCIKNIDKIGTKAIFIYPTKALANDQANRTNSLLAYVNEQLKKDGKRKITIGIYHGDITNEIYDYSIFRCPYCSNLLKHDEQGKLFCENKSCSYLSNNKREYSADNILLTRKSIHINPPDILITNPDMLNILLIERPESQTIFGRKKSLFKCDTCGEIVVTSKNRKKHSSLVKYGEKCPGSLSIVNADFSSPKFIIIDEVHLMYGAFGAHLSYLLSRLTNVIRTYNESAKIIHIASSATIRNPKRFLSAMYGVQEDMIDVFPTSGNEKKYYDFEETDESIRRYHLFSMPNAYKTTMTVSFAYFKLLEYYRKKGLDFPNVLTFVNAIAAANSLISTTRQRVGQQFNVKIDGHSTEFDKKERARKEDEFNRNLINFLFATKTLEVGVDFDRINVLGIFGSPYSFNDFLQRIGRAGRKNNALVLTFFRSFNPVDNFYYSKCHEFLNYDMLIRDKYMEDLPISRDNPVISRKAIDQALFDYLCTRNDAHEYFNINVRPFFEKTEKNPEGIYDLRRAILDEKFIEFIKNAVSPCPLTDKQIRGLVEKSINDYWENLTGRETPLSVGLRNNFYGKKFLRAMRSSDPQIPVYIPSRRGGH